MGNLTKSADQLIAEVTEVVRKDLIEKLAPIVKEMTSAAQALESVLGGSAPAAKRRGRRPGRPAKAKPGPAPKAAKKAAKAAKAGKGAKRNPRGAIQDAVRQFMASAGDAQSLSAIRDALLKLSMFQGRDAKTLYTQIVQSVKKMPEVRKTAGGKYALKAGARK